MSPLPLTPLAAVLVATVVSVATRRPGRAVRVATDLVSHGRCSNVFVAVLDLRRVAPRDVHRQRRRARTSEMTGAA
jgi:hypothetical protein